MSWIQTKEGNVFDFFDLPSNKIDIEDIAHALSHQCRFAGHTKTFYSVAEHCVRVCDTLPPAFKLWGLLHDAPEAYTQDIVRPLKYVLQETAPAFMELLREVERYVWGELGLRGEIPELVHVADVRMLLTEKESLLGDCPRPWEGISVVGRPNLTPYNQVIVPWSPDEAKTNFLSRWSHWRNLP